jgi:hypothetical protein
MLRTTPPATSARVQTRSTAAKQGVDNPTFCELDMSDPDGLAVLGALQTDFPSKSHKMIFLAMHFRRNDTKCSDNERVLASVRASLHHPYFLSVSKGGSIDDVGYYHNDFKQAIMACVNFDGDGWIGMLDWHFPQVQYWARVHYGKNWPKKCAELVQRGVDIFLMPNLVYILNGKPLPGDSPPTGCGHTPGRNSNRWYISSPQ